ncbi:MAG TPA: superoxide dismutase family protein [Tepidisphaeraceae bacterium]
MLRKIQPALWGAVAALGLAVMGCSSSNTHHEHASTAGHGTMMAADMGMDVKEAVAMVHGTQGTEKVHGIIHFTDTGSGVKVSGEVTGLEPNSKHGFHIHEFGDCSDMAKATSAGGHYNPEGHQHGQAGSPQSHVGDMGNIEADASGVAKVDVTLPTATLTGKNAILGRGVIVHAKADDYSQPVGNAGGRIGCGVIGVAQVKK